MEIKLNDYVDAVYRGSTFYGKITHVDTEHGEAIVSMAPGVSMLLPTADMTVVSEREGD